MGKNMGMAPWEWEGMTILYVSIYHPQQSNKPTYYAYRKKDEKSDPILDICILI